MKNKKKQRRYCQFGVRFLLALTLVSSIVVWWFSTRVGEVSREMEVYESLSRRGLFIKSLDRDLAVVEKMFGRKLYPDNYSIKCSKNQFDLLEKAKSLKHVHQLVIDVSKLPAPQNLSVVEHFSDLRILWVKADTLEDISAIKKHRSLTHISFSGKCDFSLNPISELVKLKIIAIANGEGIRDPEALRKLSRLEALALNRSNIKSLNFISNCKELRYLDVWRSEKLRDVSQLSQFDLLKDLRIDGHAIERYCAEGGVRDGLEILYVLGCSSLGELKISASKLTWISSDHLENLEGIESFSSCEHISILGLGIPDISAIKSLSGVDSKVKVVELPENSPGISQANSLLRNIQVVPYSR